MEAIEKEGKDCLSFLAKCSAAPQRPWGFGDSLPSPPGKCALVYFTTHSPPSIIHLTSVCPTSSSSYCLYGTWVIGPIQTATPLLQPDCIPTSIRSHPKSGPWGTTPLEEKGWNASSQSINRGSVGSLCQGFRSSTKGQERNTTRQSSHILIVRAHTTWWMFSGIWSHLPVYIDSQIYKIQEFWEGWRELQYANDVLRALPKGIQFFCAVSPSESPKVMGLAGIHNPEALHHFNSMTFCPWCGKEGQNEGTIVNHLWMTHY